MVDDRDDLQAWKRERERASRITVGELRQRLECYADDDAVTFGTAGHGLNPLLFRRIKNRGPLEGPALVCFEFDELDDHEARALYVVEPGLDD